MGTNYHTPYTEDTDVAVAEMAPPFSELDKGITYLKNVIVHNDGDYSYNKSTGVLSWSGTLRILFIREDGQSIQNTVAAGNVTINDNQFAYVDLNETNNTALTVYAATVSTGAASNFKAVDRLVLAYRNTTTDKLVAVGVQNKLIPSNSMANKFFWTGTQAEYDLLSVYDSNTIYFITE